MSERPPKGPPPPVSDDGAWRPSRAQDARKAAARIMRQRFGDAAADEFLATVKVAEERKAETDKSRAQAEQIGRVRQARGEGGEHDADVLVVDRKGPPDGGSRRRGDRNLSGSLEDKKRRKAARKQLREEKGEARSLRRKFRSRYERDFEDEVKQAESMSEKALADHGISQHYRLLPKVAYFSAYMAGLDRNGLGALKALMSINLPYGRMMQVLKAAYEPRGYTPRRNVVSGKRSHQKQYVFDDRELSGPQWEEGQRREDHPGAIRVIQVAIFLWVAKTRTRRAGHSYVVRGFGRGVFTSICRCGKDALFGHERGVPGALRALKLAGFISYSQPPATAVKDIDRGPKGHAYNAYWFVKDAAEKALDELYRRIGELSALPAVERVMEEPRLLERKLALLHSEADPWALQAPPPPRAASPPGTFTDADIPY